MIDLVTTAALVIVVAILLFLLLELIRMKNMQKEIQYYKK